MSVRYTRSAAVALAHESGLRGYTYAELAYIAAHAEKLSVGSAVRESDVTAAIKETRDAIDEERDYERRNSEQRAMQVHDLLRDREEMTA